MEQQLNDNINLIIDSIERQAQSEEKKIFELSKKLYEEKSKALEAEIKSKYDNYIDYELSKQRIAANKKASELEAEHKSELAKLREKVVKDVYLNASECIKLFAESESYENFLISSVKSMSGLYDGAAVIYMRPQDMKFQAALSEAFGKTVLFQQDESISFGGVKIHFKNAAALADDTLDSRLEIQMKEFIKSSGLGFKKI